MQRTISLLETKLRSLEQSKKTETKASQKQVEELRTELNLERQIKYEMQQIINNLHEKQQAIVENASLQIAWMKRDKGAAESRTKALEKQLVEELIKFREQGLELRSQGERAGVEVPRRTSQGERAEARNRHTLQKESQVLAVQRTALPDLQTQLESRPLLPQVGLRPQHASLGWGEGRVLCPGAGGVGILGGPSISTRHDSHPLSTDSAQPHPRPHPILFPARANQQYCLLPPSSPAPSSL